MKRLRVGVIGAGRISAGSHLPCLVNYGDVDIVLCEVDEERLAAVAAQFRIRDTRTGLPGHARARRRGCGHRPDAAGRDVRCCRDCLAAGVPTLIEKPPGMTTAETRELLATALASGADAMVAVNRRFNPLLTEARRMVEERGPDRQIVAEFYQFSMPLYRRVGSPEESLASVVVPGSIHTVDLIRYLGGDVAEVYARADAYFDRHPDSFTALIRFQNGATGLLNYNLTSPIRLERVSFHGNEASAVLEGLADSCTVYVGDTVHDLTNVRRRDPSSPEWSDRPFNPLINGWWHQDRFFLDAVREGRRIGFPGSNLEDGVKTMELIDMIRDGWNGPCRSSASTVLDPAALHADALDLGRPFGVRAVAAGRPRPAGAVAPGGRRLPVRQRRLRRDDLAGRRSGRSPTSGDGSPSDRTATCSSRHADDVLRAKYGGLLGITFDLEGMDALNDDVAMVALLPPARRAPDAVRLQPRQQRRRRLPRRGRRPHGRSGGRWSRR